MNAVITKPKRKPERFQMRFDRGALIPSDEYAVTRFQEKGYRDGDQVSVQITKARQSGYNGRVHKFGEMLASNLDAFTGLDGHAVLKRLQIEGNIACDEIAVMFPGIGPCTYRIPQSLAYESMDQGDFEAVYRAFKSHVRRTYWRELTDEQIEQLIRLMG